MVIGLIVRNSIRELTRESLRSILSANVTALEMWLSECRSDVNRLAEQDAIAAAAGELAGKYGSRSEWSLEEIQAEPANRALQDSLETESYLGWMLLDEKSRVVASSFDPLVGKSLAVPADASSRLAMRNATVCRPFPAPVALSDQGSLSHPNAPVMCAMAPIASGARTIGSLALLMDPLDRFTELLSVARTGGTGETYAFDREGTLISQSRFEHHLRAAGLLDADPLVTSPLRISVRDPGVNLTTGAIAALPREQQPLTLMADHATRGATGDNVLGYNDYRGVPVVGAWRWLPAYGMGVTTEMDVAEAYKPMQLLERSFLSLLALIALTGFGLLCFAAAIRRFNDRMRKVDRETRRLGQYDLGEVIGEGGMGSVYRGHHDLLRRDVAIKLLEGDDVNPLSISRFEREVQMTARLRHPNTIDIYDYGRTDENTFFYVMEYVDGITLHELVDEFGAQPPARVIHLMLQICGSLSEAHQLGMVHRDVKPANILLTAHAGLYDMIKVLDFGLVKEVDGDSTELTRSDGITGTPMYMSPEVVRDASMANQQSDLYSLGAVGYTLLTGLPTFEGESAVEVCLKQLDEDPVRPSKRLGRELPEDLQNVLMSCLRKDPQDRPLTVEDLASALRQCGDASDWSAGDALNWWEVEFSDNSSDEEVEAAGIGSVNRGNNDSPTTAP